MPQPKKGDRDDKKKVSKRKFPKCPNQPRLEHKLKLKYALFNLQIKTEIRNSVKEVTSKRISLIIDMWTSKQKKGVMGVTMQFIKDWELKNIPCGFKEFNEKHSGENLKTIMEQFCYTDLGINPDQVTKYFPNAFGN